VKPGWRVKEAGPPVVVWLRSILEPHSPPSRITLISHAATTAVLRAAFPLDEPLEGHTLAKIAAIGWSVPRAQHLWCGPEQRTRQTAEALGIAADSLLDLQDLDYGVWCGLELDAIQESDPDGLMRWLKEVDAAPHGGESILELIERTGSWIDGQRNAGHTLAVTHPAVIRAALLHTMNAPPQSFWRIDIAPLSLTDLRFNGLAWTLRTAGCALHKS
jgi:broad specificity phosphatase PhoE